MLNKVFRVRFIEKFNELNWNVRYLFIAAIFASLAMNMYFGIVFSVFVKAIVGSNYELGVISSIVGIVSLSGSLIGGWLADQWRRDVLIKSSLFMQSLFTVTFAVFATSWLSLVLILSIINFFLGVASTAQQALLADSIPQGDRSRVYSYFFVIGMGGGIFSPLLSILVAIYLDNVWTMTFLRALILVIAILSLLSFLSALRIDDQLSLESPTKNNPLLQTSNSDSLFLELERQSRIFRSNVKVLSVLILASFLIGFGAGVTVRFFQIFFVDVYNASPITWSLVFILTSVFTAVMGIFLQRLSEKLGRVIIMIVSQAVAIACLLLIATFPPLLLLVVFYVLRNSFMNAPGPLYQSIVMDLVPPKYRGKWIAVESLAWGLFNSTAAVIGGYIIDNFGFQAVFLFTATVYSLATVLLLPLIPKIPPEVKNTVKDPSFA